jgi:phosphoserine phosphatase
MALFVSFLVKNQQRTMSITQHPTINSFLQRHADHTSGEPKLAVFDCDYTIIQGDIGEAMFYRQIREFLFRKSPADIWTDHPERPELDRLFRDLSALPPADRSPHPAFVPFADTLLSWYFDQLAEGKVEKGCADIARLFAGFTRAEVQTIADATCQDELSAPLGEMTLGTRRLPRGSRYIQESVDLALSLTQLGFSLWAISGSNKWSVEPVFRPLGVPRGQVIGIDLVEVGGYFSTEPEEPIPIRHRKVDAIQQRTGTVPLLAVSDSRNDIPLLQYASEVRVYVNSHGRAIDTFFASTGITPDSSWVVIETPTVINGMLPHG